MATHDYIISNASGAAVRSDLNSALAAIVSNNSNATEPATTYSYMWWADTTAGQLKLRNADNDGWITIQELDGTMLMEDGAVGTPGLAFASDLDTGFYRPADNELGIATGGTNAVYIDDAQQVGIGTTSPTDTGGYGRALDIQSDTGAAIYLRTNDDTSQIAQGPSDLTIRTRQAHPIIFNTDNAERARIDSSGRLLVGTSSAINTADGTLLQVGDTNGARQILGNSSTTIATNVNLGMFSFRGFDSSTWNEGARIAAVSNGGHSSTSVPTDLRFYTTTSGSTSVTERMRVRESGYFSSFSTAGTFNVRNSSSGATDRIFQVSAGCTTITAGGTTKFAVEANGDVLSATNSYGSLSDIKLKENIVDASSQWDDLKAIQVRKYNFKEETGQATHTQLGVIAQELELVSPGLVKESPDQDEEGNDLGTTTKSVRYSVLYMKAVKALQEAMERIETLEAKVAALESA